MVRPISDEKKAKNADRLREYREKRRLQNTPSSGPEEVVPKTPIKAMSAEERRTYNRVSQRRARETNKGVEETSEVQVDEAARLNESVALMEIYEKGSKKRSRAAGTEQTLSTPAKKSMFQVEDVRKDDEEKISEKKSRGKRKQGAGDTSIQSSSAKKRKKGLKDKDHTKDDSKDKEELNSDQKFDCKIRFGLMDIFEVEADCMILPHYGDLNFVDRSTSYNQFMRDVLETNEQREAFKENLIEEASFETYESNGFYMYDWDQWMRKCDPVLNIHIPCPYLKEKEKYSIVTEANLRLAYLKCLRHADGSFKNSVVIPIIGKGIDKKISLALAFQVSFAYFEIMKKTNLKLVYIVTNNINEYDELGEFVGFIREIDLMHWTRQQFFEFENYIFNKLQPDVFYSSIPGMGMAWRGIINAFEHGKKKKQIEKLKAINELASGAYTQIPHQYFNPVPGKSRIMPKHHAEDVNFNEEPLDDFIDTRFPLSHQCGSNAVLRKIWVVSFYFMYYTCIPEGLLDFDESCEQHRKRKFLFHRLKHLHSTVRKLWNRTVKYVPFKCDCSQTGGYHEKFFVFKTKMSLPDPVFNQWILSRKNLILDLSNVAKMEDVNIGYVPMRSREVVVVKSDTEMQEFIKEKSVDWFTSRKEWLDLQNQNISSILNTLHISDDSYKTGFENENALIIDVLEYDNLMDKGYFATDVSEKEKYENAKKELEDMTTDKDDVDEAQKTVQECLRVWAVKRLLAHVDNELNAEIVFRSRIFKKFELLKEPSLPEELWQRMDNGDCTVDQYLAQKMEHLKIDFKEVPAEAPTEESPLNVSTSAFDLLFQNFPPLLDLGERTVLCVFCQALDFPTEVPKACCKNGAVWLDPEKFLPDILDKLFKKKLRSFLLAVNAAFSMASISFDREPQAARGIQSLKIRGGIFFFPSNLFPRNPNRPRFANFIILDLGNEDIAKMRLDSLPKSHKDLEEIMVQLQEYFDANNVYYGIYKSMKEIYEEASKDLPEGTELTNGQIHFEIIPPGRMSDEKIAEYQAHKGRYAKPCEMKSGCVTVAYTHYDDDTVDRERGLKIYPRNPQNADQFPISMYSDQCEIMSYPCLFPDGIGGYGHKKYRRIPEKERKRCDERLKEFKEKCLLEGKDPKDYIFEEEEGTGNHEYSNNDTNEDGDDNSNKRTDSSTQSAAPNADSSNHTSPDTTQNSCSNDVRKDVREEHQDNNDDDDENYYEINEEQMEFLAILEQIEEVPADDTAGKQKKIVMVERNGDMYPVAKGYVDIPDAACEDFFGDEIKEGNPYSEVVEGLEEVREVEEVEEMEKGENSNEEDFEDPFDGRSFLKNRNQEEEEVAIDFEDGHEATNNQETAQEDNFEDVCFGDDNYAEPTATDRQNDGVRKIVNVGPRTHVSLAEYHTFRAQDRPFTKNKYQGNVGKLGQLHTIDAYIRTRARRHQAIVNHRAEFRSAINRSNLFKHYERQVSRKLKGKKRLGMLVTMPSTVPGTAKYQRELVMSAVTVSNKLGKPDLFVTFTGNPKWPEIQRECEEQGCDWADIPYFVNRIFHIKFREFMKDLTGKPKKCSSKKGKLVRQAGMFGKVKWFNYSIEFQQRGMPHAHILLALKTPITNAGQVDNIVSAEVPPMPQKEDADFADKLRYYNLVKELMTHFPCQHDNTSYCNQGKQPTWKKCVKDFPKELIDATQICDDRYPKYKRTTKNQFTLYRNKKAITAGSEYVVSHNPALLLKYGTHINVEIVSSIKTMKYMFKYIHKGSDRILLEASENLQSKSLASDAITMQGSIFAPRNLPPGESRRRQREDEDLMRAAKIDVRSGDYVSLNDCSYMLDCAACTSCEAAWKLAGYPMHGSSHSVHRVHINDENNDLTYFPRGVASVKDMKKALAKKAKGTMNAWFEANQKPVKLPNGEMSDSLTLPEMLHFFKFDSTQQKFILRKKDYSENTFGRIQAPQPKYLELVATRLLALNVAGPKSWAELRTFKGVEYKSCLDAAVARRLMNGEREWEDALEEITSVETPLESRRFFASILAHSAPAEPEKLWEKYKDRLVENKRSWTMKQKFAHALKHISMLLERHGMTLRHYQLDTEYSEDDLPYVDPAEDIDNPKVDAFKPSQHKTKSEQMYKQLNEGQKVVVDRALELAEQPDNRNKMMFVSGAGGTGKTFCYNTIYHTLRAKEMNVVTVAHTGIAACLLPYGCTAHRKFSLPITVSDRMHCKVSNESTEGILLKKTNAIIWDEACMSDRRIFNAVDNLFRQLKESEYPFGGILLLMGGDWRQILPIVEGVHGPGTVAFILKNGELWKDVERFELTKNQRASIDPAYAKLILDIGDGKNYVPGSDKLQYVEIPSENVIRGDESEIVNWVYPDVNKIEDTKRCALLTVDNKTALRLNDLVVSKLNQEEHVFTSVDTPDKASADPQVFARETPSGMPPHVLRLKKGAQVVLLRNLAVHLGLCNGTRLTVIDFGTDIIHCTVNTPSSNSPSRVFLHRTIMVPNAKDSATLPFKRLQFPIRLAYACTINKSQGQTLEKCGLVLHCNPFAHGMLYVAMSRVRQSSDFKIWHYPRNDQLDYALGPLGSSTGGILVKNIVYQDALRDVGIKEILEKNLPIQRKDPIVNKPILPLLSLQPSNPPSPSLSPPQSPFFSPIPSASPPATP